MAFEIIKTILEIAFLCLLLGSIIIVCFRNILKHKIVFYIFLGVMTFGGIIWAVFIIGGMFLLLFVILNMFFS
jgi:hypothetical protein